MYCSTPGFPVLHCLPEFAQAHDQSQEWYPTISSSAAPFSSCPPSFPSSGSLPLSLLCIRWTKYWSFSFSIHPSSEYSGLISLGLIGLISLQSRGLSRGFSNTTVRKHQFFGAQPSFWSGSHIHTWLLEKPWLWLIWTFLGKMMSLFF